VPLYLVERCFSDGLDSALLQTSVDQIRKVNNETGVTWVHSYVTDVKLHTYCLLRGVNSYEHGRLDAPICSL